MSKKIIDVFSADIGNCLSVNTYTGSKNPNSIDPLQTKRLQFGIGREYTSLTKEQWEQLKEAIEKEFV